MSHQAWLRAALFTAAACSGSSTGTTPVNQGPASGSVAASGGGGASTASGSPSQGTATGAGMGTSAGTIAGSGSGASSGAGGVSTGTSPATSGGSGAQSSAGSSGGSGAPASSGTVLGSGAVAGSGLGAAGSSGGTASGSGTTTGGGTSGTTTPPHGGSTGCGRAPTGASSTAFTNHKITIPSCGDGGLAYPDCIAASFAPGGRDYLNKNGEDYNHRDYSIQLPTNYDPTTPTPVFFGGGGCGGPPPQTGAGFGINETGAIEIGLQAINGCFADGGTYCASTANAADCDQGPELPYFLAILNEIEAAFCVDRGNVFVGGFSSGAWEAFTLGCGGAGAVRGIVTDEGGWRNHQPSCPGPVAALMVAGELDSDNPIGPLVMGMPYTPAGMSVQNVDTAIQSLDSFGSAPGRDQILSRNGCVGTATTAYDANYPACVKYTGCPAAYPVVWCPLPGAAHNDSSSNGVNYSPGSVKGDPLMWGFLSKLPPVP